MVDLSANTRATGQSSPLPQALSLPTLSPARGAALLLVAGGLFFAFFGQEYRTGTLRSMGPGMFPVAGGIILAAIGLLLLLRSLRDSEAAPTIAWRPLGAIIGSVLAFALTVGPFGLIVAGPLLVIGAVLATGQGTFRLALILATTLTTFAIIVFPVLLGVPLKVLP
ncbi:MAG: tripartite tricarboxylate transporter TctB family protein [Hyphomicrobiales bacterium]|nr:MAG: tripartite tricarboxylate transporter TctB family protein [Hyphomicrobiales bacterium]